MKSIGDFSSSAAGIDTTKVRSRIVMIAGCTKIGERRKPNPTLPFCSVIFPLARNPLRGSPVITTVPPTFPDALKSSGSTSPSSHRSIGI